MMVLAKRGGDCALSLWWCDHGVFGSSLGELGSHQRFYDLLKHTQKINLLSYVILSNMSTGLCVISRKVMRVNILR